MHNTELINRLAALPNLQGIPGQELEWLVVHGRLEIYEAGKVIGLFSPGV